MKQKIDRANDVENPLLTAGCLLGIFYPVAVLAATALFAWVLDISPTEVLLPVGRATAVVAVGLLVVGMAMSLSKRQRRGARRDLASVAMSAEPWSRVVAATPHPEHSIWTATCDVDDFPTENEAVAAARHLLAIVCDQADVKFRPEDFTLLRVELIESGRGYYRMLTFDRARSEP